MFLFSFQKVLHFHFHFDIMQKTKVAIIGAGFITDIHMESYHRFVPEAEVVAVYARKIEKAKAFAEKHKIPKWYDDH